MSIQSTNSSNSSNSSHCTAFTTCSKERLANNNALFLQLPSDVLTIIMHKVCNEKSLLKASIRAVEFGRVCILTHLLTHSDETTVQLLNNEKRFIPLVSIFCEPYPPRFQAQGIPILDRMQMVLGETDQDSARDNLNRIFEDFLKDSPGMDPNQARLEFDAQLRIYLDQYDTNNLRDLFSVYYTVFKKSAGVVLKTKYPACIEQPLFRTFALQAVRNLAAHPNFSLTFCQHIGQDLVEYFAKGPLEQITIEKYKEFTQTLLKDSILKPQDLEMVVRKTILAHHKPSEFTALQEQYANPTPELLKSIMEQLRAERTEELQHVEAELYALCGSNFNGAIDAAYRVTQAAEKSAADRRYAYSLELDKQADRVAAPDSSIEDLNIGQARISNLYSAYMEAHYQCQNTQAELKQLNEKLAQLAVWTNGVISSGQKVEIQASLQQDKLSGDAHLRCQVISEFYAQLSSPIDDMNKEEQFELLHGIIG